VSGVLKKIRWALFFILSIALSANIVLARAEAERDNFLPVREIVIYTDGLGFVVHEGEVAPSDDGTYNLERLPRALKGSLNVFPKDTSVLIEQVTTYQEEQTIHRPLETGAEFFNANSGRPIQLLAGGEAVTGRVKRFLAPDLLVVTVNHENGVTSDHVYPLEKITAFYLLEPAVVSKEVQEKVGKLRIEAGGKSSSGPLAVGLSYLQTGVTWNPEYTLDLQSSERGGTLSLSAVIRNDLVDLAGATVYLAEDGPRFNREISPLVVFDEGADELGKIPFYTAEVTARGVAKQAMDLASGIKEEYIPSLLMYKKSDIFLNKGERAILPIFQGVVRVEPIYRLELARSFYNSELVKEPIYKGYRVYNDSKMHLVAGEVLVKMGDKPLALQEFPFIAPRSFGEIRVLTEKSIISKVTEVEFERIQGALTYHDRQYSSIQVRGEIELHNTKDENIMINVTHLAPGEVTEASDGAALTKKAGFGSGPNPQTEVVWEVPLPARGVKVLTYVYQTYLH